MDKQYGVDFLVCGYVIPGAGRHIDEHLFSIVDLVVFLYDSNPPRGKKIGEKMAQVEKVFYEVIQYPR